MVIFIYMGTGGGSSGRLFGSGILVGGGGILGACSDGVMSDVLDIGTTLDGAIGLVEGGGTDSGGTDSGGTDSGVLLSSPSENLEK